MTISINFEFFRGLKNSATRKNMKRLLTIEQYKKLCKRNIIEICWGQLKRHFQLITG